MSILMRRWTSLFLVLCLCFQVTGCSLGTSDGEENKEQHLQTEEITKEKAFKKAKKMVKKMSLEEKIGQLFLVDLNKIEKKDKPITEYNEEVKEWMSRYQVGGVILDSTNVVNTTQIKELNEQLAQCMDVPLYIGTTEEGGGEKSIAEKNDDIRSTGYTTPEEMGKNMTAGQLKDTGAIIGGELSELGFNLNFAPNADVVEVGIQARKEDAFHAVQKMLQEDEPKLEDFLEKKKNKKGKVSKKRARKAKKEYAKAHKKYMQKVERITETYTEEMYFKSCFGKEEKVVSTAVESMIQGMHTKDIATVLNTFPGISSVAKYHKILPMEIDTGVSRLRRVNFAPYVAGIKADTDCIMVAHVALSKIDGSSPSSLSKVIISDLLRDELGFEGVVITEAMDLPVIVNEYTTEQAVIRAVVSGADMIYNPQDLEEGIMALKRAVMFREISEKAINQAVLRILQNKIMRGIIK